jgi:hypothetical protein
VSRLGLKLRYLMRQLSNPWRPQPPLSDSVLVVSLRGSLVLCQLAADLSSSGSIGAGLALSLGRLFTLG